MELTNIPDTNYVILPDGTVARKLTPTLKKDGLYWFLHIGNPGKVIRFTDKEVADPVALRAKIAKNTASVE
jgi:hypothetical protein